MSAVSTEYFIRPVQFTTQGRVIHGDKIGRTIGFPTANLDVALSEDDIEPGVYLGRCDFSLNPELPDALAHSWHCLPYFGPRLIFGELKNSFEVYIFDFDQQIYDLTLKVSISYKLRDPVPIPDLSALQAQLAQDKAVGLDLLCAK